MSDRTVENIVNILSRNTIDGSAVEKTLISASVKNFNTLYDIQRDLIGFKRFDVPITELERVYKLTGSESKQHYPIRYVHRVPYSMVSGSNRRACKEAGFYGVPLTQETISAEYKVFDFNFLIFVDGHLIDTGEIIVNDSETVFILDVSTGKNTNYIDGIPMKDYVRYCEDDEIVTFLIVPNYKCAVSSFNKNTFNDVMNKAIHYNRFSGDTSSLANPNTLFFMNNNNDPSTKDGFFANVDTNTSKVHPSSDMVIDDMNISVMAITLNDVYEIRRFSIEDSAFFQLDDKYESILPVENIMIFSDIGNGRFTFNNKISLKLYYPNIYEIENWDKESDIIMYIMYKETNDAQHYNELNMLKMLSGNLVNRYEDKSLPEEVMDYRPMDIQWLNSSDKFKSSIYFPKKSLYNIDALSDIVLRNPHFLAQYAHLKMKGANKYYINVAKLSLEGRVRNDTYKECEDTGDIVYFDEPCYLFSLQNKFTGPYTIDFRMFIDNHFINPFQYTLIIAMDYYHFYIPCSLIKEDSIIELDKYNEYDFTRFHTFENVNDEVTIEIPKHIKQIYAQDINVVDEDTRLFIPTSHYKILAYSDIMEEDIELNQTGYATIKNSFRLQLVNDLYVNKKLRIYVCHRLVSTSISQKEIDESNIPLTIKLATSTRLNSDKIRVYTAGKMLPSSLYGVTSTGMYLGKSSLTLFFDVSSDSELYKGVTFDQVPIGQICEFYQAEVDEYGFVDTGNSLSLPLDLRWYDIYVNGLKLNKSNVDIVTSSKFFIKNINSRTNLCIYARGDVYNEFELLHDETEDNKLFNSIDEIYEELMKDREIIPDDMDDIIGDLLTNIMNHHKFVMDILEYSFINANEQQITDEIKMLFPDLIDEYGILWLDSNTYSSARSVTMINSNIRGEEMKNDQYRYAWTPLHIGSHDDAKKGEYMCDPITGAPGMKNQDGSIIATGELDRLNIHMANFQNTLGYMNLLGKDIYQIQFNENTSSRDVTDGNNFLDEPIELTDITINKMVLSLDVQVLTKGYKDVMTFSEVVPMVNIELTNGEESKTIQIPLNTIAEKPIEIYSSSLVITGISLSIPEDVDVKCVLHSILLAI